MQIIRYSSLKPTPWKNGGGVTYEALRVPPSGDPFRWRASVAHIDAAGPFSDFAGYHRIMVLLRGSGIRLGFAGAGEATLREVGDVMEFDGATSTHCDLLDGPCTDFNLMVLKSFVGATAWVEGLAPGRIVLEPTSATLLFGISGSWSILAAGGEWARLAPWDLAVVSQGEPAVLDPGPSLAERAAVDPGSLRDQRGAHQPALDALLAGEGPPPLVFFATLRDNST